MPLLNVGSISNTMSSNMGTNALYQAPLAYRWLRARVTAYTFGAIEVAAAFFLSLAAMHAMDVAAGQSGTWVVQPVPGTTNGLSVFHRLWPANVTEVNAKTSAGQLYGYHAVNLVATTRSLKLYNKASAPTRRSSPWSCHRTRSSTRSRPSA